MPRENSATLPQAFLPTTSVRLQSARAGKLAKPLAGGRSRTTATSIRRPGLGVALGAALGAFLAGLATTLYVTLGEWQGVAVRPVQLLPVLLLPIALVAPRRFAIPRQLPLRCFAILWLAYMVGRFLLLEPTDPLTAMRALTCVATFFAAMELSSRQKLPDAAMIGLVAGCLVSVAVAAADISVLDKEPRYYGSARWTGLMPDPNRFADLCGMACVICFGMLIQQSTRSTRLAWAFALAICGGGLLASGSRGGLSATAAASLATIWISNKVQNRRPRLFTYLKPIAWLGILGVVIFYFFGAHISDRVLEFVSLSSDGRANVTDDPRRDIAYAALQKFLASPVIGGGTQYLAFDNIDLASHNSYLFLLSTSGVIGFGLYGALLLALARSLWRIVRQRSIPLEMKKLSTPALGGLIFLMLHMCVIDLILSAHAWAFFGFASAVIMRCTANNCVTTLSRRRVCG